jgi:F-type H+-transporting ATPase subunit a
MNNLFSIFDPRSIFNIRLNWARALAIAIFIPSYFWLVKRKPFYIFSYVFNYLNKEFSIALGGLKSQGLTHIFISIFLFISVNNFLGLFPYIFTSSSHLTFTVALALPLWVGYIVYSTFLNLGRFLAHLVPLGTPYALMPFMVVIELVRRIIRPLTLSVRLAANIVAGHLLMVLVRSPITTIRLNFIALVISALLLLIMLELAVSFIQAYVFSTLISLYVIEVNSPNL